MATVYMGGLMAANQSLKEVGDEDTVVIRAV